jgi:hypothetical protein
MSVLYISLCTDYGVPETDLFQAVDLIEKKGINLVTMTIFALGRTVSFPDISHILPPIIFLFSSLGFFNTQFQIQEKRM